MLNKTEGKELWNKKKRNLLGESKFFQKAQPQILQKTFSDHAGSFRTAPGPILGLLREYWTGNGEICLADFSYFPSELT